MRREHAFTARRRAVERIGLLAVRDHRLTQLAAEERSWREALDRKAETRPELAPPASGPRGGAPRIDANLTTIAGHTGGPCKGESDEQRGWHDKPASSGSIRKVVDDHVTRIFGLLDRQGDERQFDEVERSLRDLVFALGRLLLAFYLARRHETSDQYVARWARRGLRRPALRRKHLHTFFGRVTYWRTHLRPTDGKGVHPLDVALGLTADAFSFLVVETSARLSTLLSYEQVTAVLLYFLSWSPSKTSVERSVLGLGRQTSDWFASAPAPEGDGEVLVIQIDSKATPTATDEELEKRRGKRNRGKKAPSPRHRGKQNRQRRGSKKRRKKGDKSKNGRAATLVLMYSLRKAVDENGKSILLGPLNKRVYASYASKRHAFAVARREATKRGFGPKTRKLVHLITDGDEDLERNAKKFFPNARHTLDIVHVLEYFWEAGRFAYPEGSPELAAWVKARTRQLYAGQSALAVLALNELDVAPGQRKRLAEILSYLQKRLKMMKYDELRAQDLDVSSGAVEGGVRHVIAKRFDCGGMRWIRERAEALLALRCIEINGDWDEFVRFARGRALAADPLQGEIRVLSKAPASLPTLEVAA